MYLSSCAVQYIVEGVSATGVEHKRLLLEFVLRYVDLVRVTGGLLDVAELARHEGTTRLADHSCLLFVAINVY